MLASAGFEFVVIDMEHSPLTLDFAYQRDRRRAGPGDDGVGAGA